MRTMILSLVVTAALMGCDADEQAKDTGGAAADTGSTADDADDTGDDADTGDEPTDEPNPDEQCDGMDNDGDGLVDEALSILWFDGVEDELVHTLVEGVRTFRMEVDGDAEMTNIGSEEDAPVWVITSADGAVDATQAIHYRADGGPLVNLIDYTDDAAAPLAETWTYDDTHAQRTAYSLYESSALTLRQTWSEFTSENTPDGLVKAQRTRIDTGGINLEMLCTTGFEAGSWEQECDYTMSGTPYYRSVVHWDHVDGLYTSGWAEITLLADYFGESRLYRRTEYTHDDRGQRSETRTATYPIGTSGEPAQVVVTRWTRDDDHRVVLKEELTEAGERLSAVEYAWADGRTERVEIDEDADGEVDLVKSAVHDDGRLVEYREERLAGEHPVGQPPPMSLFIAEYDEHQTLTGTRTDWDGDGTWDIVRSRTVSCEAEPHGFDPEDYDHDRDGYAPADGDCDDTDASVYPGAPETAGDGIDQDCDGADAS